jgi:TolA-binding protein
MSVGRLVRIFGLVAALAPATSFAIQLLTAEELYNKSINAYNAGRYAEAAAGFQKFEKDYGKSEQSQTALAAMRYPLAMCLLQLQKFDDASEAIDAALTTTPPPAPAQKEDLVFYKAVCEMQGENWAAARKTLDAFVREFPRSRRTSEARLLYGTTWLLEEKYADAATQFAGIRPLLDPVNRGRATVLEFYALMQEQKLDDALALVIEEFPRMDQMLQIATFQTLALQLGSEFLEQKQYRKAIAALQRVWSRDRLMKYQQSRLDELEDALSAAEAQPKSDPYRKFQLKQMIAKVKREVGNLEKIQNFDSALRLRLATAYQAMRRYRESALIMEGMLADLPPDSVVESASVSLVQCWSAIERWPKVVESAQAFAEKFPKSKQLPLVLYLEGIAQQRANDQAAAIATFDAIRKRFPESDFAARAWFMKGFSELLADQNKAAVATFEEFIAAHPKHALADAAAYWRGMGYSLDKQFARTREVMDEYLARHKNGAFRGLATFRKAYAAQSQRDFKTSIRELEGYLKKYPGHESNDEALVLLGDALMDQGRIEEGIAAFEKISPDDAKFFEEGWFKIGKAYRLLEQPDKLRAHFEKFVAEHPRSPRVAEAIYWIGWTDLQAGHPDKAREVYWKAIADHGADATIRSVDELFPALQKLYAGDKDMSAYLDRLRDLRAEADENKQPTLAMRALWAQALVYVKSDPERARGLLIDAATRANVSETNPRLLADFASAYAESGRTKDAERMWHDLVKWNPRAPEKADAFAALGLLAMERGDDAAALTDFDRFEKETLGSLAFGKVMLAKAKLLLARGDSEDARKALEALLANPYATGPQKAEALYRLGNLCMQAKDYPRAVAYFQRIYIMHSRWHDWTAKAYLSSGEAFEELNDVKAARKTYQEMTGLEELQALPETAKARERLEALGAGGKPS